MHKHDRELLARIARVHRSTGEITLELLKLIADDAAYAAGLRQIADAFKQLSADLLTRADELDPSGSAPGLIERASAHPEPLAWTTPPDRSLMTTTSFTSDRAHGVLTAACESAGLDADDAVLLRFGENAIYRLPGCSAVGRVGRSVSAARKEVNVARWLAGHGYPAGRVLPDIEQPVIIEDTPVTFWEYIEDNGEAVSSAEFGKILHDLHALPHPSDFTLPDFAPMPKVEKRLEELSGQLPDADLQFLRHRYEKVSADFEEIEFVLPPGPIHGDAHPGNIMRPTGGPLTLIDFEDFAFGPREWDAAVLSVRHQAFGWASDAEYRAYTDAYGFDPIDWSGFPVLRAARELNMTTWLAQSVGESLEIETEVRRRIADLRDDQAPRHWRVF